MYSALRASQRLFKFDPIEFSPLRYIQATEFIFMKNSISVHGTYLLLLECNYKAELVIGKLGKMSAEPGYYLYVGSAFGPGGIQARVRHHQQMSLRPHWHIDYLRTVAELVDVWCVHDFRCEHEWARTLEQFEDTLIPLQRFGSSDCKCVTHLFQLKHRPVKAVLERVLETKLNSVNVSDPG